MKNLFLTKTRWLVTIILLTTLGSGNAWGEEITYTFSSKSWAASPANWTSNTDGSSFESSGSARGVANNGVNGACTSPITFANVSSISIVASSNTTGGKVAIKIGDTQIANKEIANGNNKTYTYNSDDDPEIANLSGNVQIVVTKPSSKTVWVKSITITYSAETPTLTCGTTSLSFEAAVDGTDTKNFTFSGSNLTANASLAISGTNAAMFSVAPTSVNKGSGTITDQSVTVTYSPTAAGSHSATLTISSTDATDKTITLSGTATLSHNVYYYNNGTLVHTGTVADGGNTDALWDGLDDNDACDDVTYKYFAGWSKTNFGSTPISNPTLNEAYTSVSDDVSYYAVWSDTDPASAGGWTKVGADELAVGDKVVFVYAGATNKEMTGVASNLGTATGITTIPDDITGSYVLTVEAGNGGSGYSFKNGSDYLSWSNSGNNLYTTTTKDNTSSWTISTSTDGNYKFANVGTTSRILQYNSGSPRWACYTSSQSAFQIYKQSGGGDAEYITTCQACVAPTSVTITGTNKYLGGQTISLTAAPDGGTGTPSYQWQKKISGVWTNLANDGSISGVTSNNLQISSCSYVNSGGYRCIVSTGDGCETKSHADDTNGYGVHVFSIHGKYTTDADYSDTEIIWTSETTGTATISMDAKKTYLFKVWSNNGYYYGHGANTNEDFMFQPTTWDCGVNNNEMRLFTTVAGNYTFTVNIEHGLDGSPYVNVQVGYPSMTHPNSGYVYVQKFNWQPYLHYWYDNSHPLSTWGSDPQLAANQYTSICGTDYWCVPVIDYYCNFIAKDAAGNPSNTTGDQHTNSPHPGQRLYNNGSWKWGEFSTYTIAYAGGDGSTGGPMASHTGLCPGSSQQLTANAFSKAYHTFNGWSDGNGHTYADQAMIENIQSNINLTAQWRDLASYTVNFSADNGTVAGGTAQTVYEEGKLTFPNVTSTTCGTFIGWVEAAYDNTAAPSGATFHAAGSQIDVVAELEGKTYYAVYRVATGMATTLTDNLVPSDFKATGTSYEATNNLVKTSSATYEAVTAKGNNAIQINKISDGRGIVSKISGGIFKGITLTTNANHSASRKVYVYGSRSYTAAYADPAAFKDNSSVRGTLLATLEGATKTYSTSTDDYEYIAIFADGAAYMDQIDITWYGAPMKYQTSPACSPVINMTSSFSSFTYVYGSGPSASQSFTVSGANLGANLVVTAPANYEVCKTFGGDYTTSVSYTPSDGTVTDQTVYIRLKAGLNVDAYNYAAASGVSAASTGATTRTAALTGSVTKAAGAIAFTDFNAGDHYEAEWTGSAILVPYNYILTGDGTLTTTKVDGRGGTVDTENKKWSLTNEGTYQLRLTLGNGTNYTGAGPVTADFVIYKADRFYDNLHGNDVIVKRNDTGEDHYTIPSLTDESRQTSGSCSETHYHFMGWVPESALSTLSNDAAYDAVMITGGGTQAASGTNYYAVWAEE